MELRELYNKMIAEGFKRFYIEGIGGPISDDVEVLGKIGSEWAVFYVERGKKSPPIFTTKSQEEAVAYYQQHVSKIEHWHIVVFTRSKSLMESRKVELEKNGIRVIQNDIPHYSKKDDIVYRLFVVNKDIFKAQELFEVIPLFDEALKR
jgi:hypothetical protein